MINSARIIGKVEYREDACRRCVSNKVLVVEVLEAI